MRFTLKIFRGHPGEQYWEEFSLESERSSNVIAALMEIRKNPVTKQGKTVAPVAWESGCLEEVCGSCTMLINGRPRQACTALIESFVKAGSETEIVLAPLTKYPLMRDLVTDRSAMFEGLKKVGAWIETEGTFAEGPGPVIFPEKQEVMYALSSCMTCGCCTEACPQVNSQSKFLGPAVVNQVRLMNDNPVGYTQRSRRLDPMLEEGGILGCGNAQNCVRVCPKKIPLTDSIAAVFRDANEEALRRLFSFPDRS